MIVRAREFAWRGLNTKATSTGLPVLDSVVLQDMRVVGTDLIERLGIVRVAQLSGLAKATDLDAASSEKWTAPADSRVWALGQKFAIEAVVSADDVTGTHKVFQAGHTTASVILEIAGGDWQWTTADASNVNVFSAGTAATGLTTLQLVRNGASLTTRINGVAGNTSSNHGTTSLRAPVGDLDVGATASTDYFDGKIDNLRVLSIAKTHHRDRLIRLPNPRAAYVLADYDFNESAAGLAYDRSRYENHLIATNTPTEATSLSHNPAAVRALSMMPDENGRKQLLLVAGGTYYIAAVG